MKMNVDYKRGYGLSFIIGAIFVGVLVICIIAATNASTNKSTTKKDIETSVKEGQLEERFGTVLPEGSKYVVDKTTGVCYVLTPNGSLCPIYERDGSVHVDGEWARSHSKAVA